MGKCQAYKSFRIFGPDWNLFYFGLTAPIVFSVSRRGPTSAEHESSIARGYD